MLRGRVCFVGAVLGVERERLVELRLRRGRRYGGLCLRDEGVWMDAGVSLHLVVLEFLRRRERCTALERWGWSGRSLARQFDLRHWKVELVHVHVLLHPRVLRHPIRAPKTLAA